MGIKINRGIPNIANPNTNSKQDVSFFDRETNAKRSLGSALSGLKERLTPPDKQWFSSKVAILKEKAFPAHKSPPAHPPLTKRVHAEQKKIIEANLLRKKQQTEIEKFQQPSSHPVSTTVSDTVSSPSSTHFSSSVNSQSTLPTQTSTAESDKANSNSIAFAIPMKQAVATTNRKLQRLPDGKVANFSKPFRTQFQQQETGPVIQSLERKTPKISQSNNTVMPMTAKLEKKPFQSTDSPRLTATPRELPVHAPRPLRINKSRAAQTITQETLNNLEQQAQQLSAATVTKGHQNPSDPKQSNLSEFYKHTIDTFDKKLIGEAYDPEKFVNKLGALSNKEQT